MSLKLMSDVFDLKVGNATKKLVLLKLADNANDKGECWPSYQHIADQCECSRSTAQKYIFELKKDGLLTINPRFGATGCKSNLYKLTIEPVPRDGIGIPSDGTTPIPRGGIRTSNSFEPVIKGDYPLLNFDKWEEWVAYRKSAKLKAYTTHMIVKKLCKYSKEVQAMAIDNSIENQYSGLFPEKYTGNQNATGKKHNQANQSAASILGAQLEAAASGNAGSWDD